jgi:hypothetical protein
LFCSATATRLASSVTLAPPASRRSAPSQSSFSTGLAAPSLVPGGGGRRARALGHEDRGVGDDGVDLAEQVADQVDAVRTEIAQDAVAAALALEAPAQRALGVRGVVAQQTKPSMGDLSDFSVGQ